MAKGDNLTETLNLRIDPSLATEIERIAARRGMTGSEVARELLAHGVQVERLVEAQELKRHYSSPPYQREAGRVAIDARFEWYTNREIQEMELGPDLDEYGDPIS